MTWRAAASELTILTCCGSSLQKAASLAQVKNNFVTKYQRNFKSTCFLVAAEGLVDAAVSVVAVAVGYAVVTAVEAVEGAVLDQRW